VYGQELRFGAAELRQTVRAFALNQGQKSLPQKLGALGQAADFLRLRQQVIVECQCGSHAQSPSSIKYRIIVFTI
jgi:hypothetical protein